MAYLGQVDPFTVYLASDYLKNKALNWWEEQKIKELVNDFPQVFDQAVEDWAKLKVGAKAGLFTPQQIKEALTWFSDFPNTWETIRPNFIKTPEGLAWGGKVDDFIGRLKRDDLVKTAGLGLAPVIIAGVLIVGGVAAGLWAVQYIQEQRNISEMIDQVVAGKLPPSVLQKAVDAEKGSLFGDIADAAQFLLIGGAALFLLPQLRRLWK